MEGRGGACRCRRFGLAEEHVLLARSSILPTQIAGAPLFSYATQAIGLTFRKMFALAVSERALEKMRS